MPQTGGGRLRERRFGSMVEIPAPNHRLPMPPVANPAQGLSATDVQVVRVIVVEDHAMVREGLVALLAQECDLSVCGQAGDSTTARALVARTRPHVVLLDVFLGDGEDCARLVRDLIASPQPPAILAISMHREEDVAERLARAGVRGFLSKQETPQRLVEAVRTVAGGGAFFGPRVLALLTERAFHQAPPQGYATLTARELQVFRLIGAGIGVTEIGERLGVSTKTVAAHRENLKAKLTCQTAAELHDRARRWIGIAP
jgi:DNA-binding NarL/FixJ family response regulator